MMDGIGSSRPAGREGRCDRERAAPDAQQATNTQGEFPAMSETPPTLPVASSGYKLTRFNALQHGVLSRYTVLPWESGSEYRDLLHALADEHRPNSPTEEHLVEELAGVLWRKRRLRQAEAAAYRRGLSNTRQPYSRTAKAAVAHLSHSVSQ